MEQYHLLVERVLAEGARRADRTGVGTLSVFGAQSRYDLREGFPLMTTKKVLFPAVVRELLWFLRGSTNIHDDLARHTPIWNAWADEGGELGPIYGHQWRSWGGPFATQQTDKRKRPAHAREGIDQIAALIHDLKHDQNSRRMIVSAWNVQDLPHMALPPCHVMFQCYVDNGRLDLQMYQRSADLALGVPFNIASYALLLTILAQQANLTPGVLVHTIGDAHVYVNHVEGLREQLTRTPYPLPRVTVAKRPLDLLRFDDVTLHDYQHHPFIRFDVAV